MSDVATERQQAQGQAVCPLCGGEGYVWHEGTTGPYGDDPSDWVPCECTREPVVMDWDEDAPF